MVAPEQGLTLPGLLIVCGDSHTSTHGALGAYAFGIGASEVAHVLMTQTIWQSRPKRMRITIDGALTSGLTAKDVALSLIAKLGTGYAQGFAVEYAGPVVENLSIEGRLTLCNLSDRTRFAAWPCCARRCDIYVSARSSVCASRAWRSKRRSTIGGDLASDPERGRSIAK